MYSFALLALFFTLLPIKCTQSKLDFIGKINNRVDYVLVSTLPLTGLGTEDQDQVHQTLTSPNPCSNPEAALKELRRWFIGLERAVKIGMTLPGLEQLYRGTDRHVQLGLFGDAEFVPGARARGGGWPL